MLNWVHNPNSSTWGLQEPGQDPTVPQCTPGLLSSAVLTSWDTLCCFIHLFPTAFPRLVLSLSFFEMHLVLSDLSRTVSPLLSLLLGEFNLLALQLFLCLLLDTLSH